MQLRWIEAAEADLRGIADYLFEPCRSMPRASFRQFTTLLQCCSLFLALAGPGKKQGTRELVLDSLPYIVVYAVKGEVIHIARILHGAQKWP